MTTQTIHSIWKKWMLSQFELDLLAVCKKHGYHPRNYKFQGQTEMEEKIIAKRDRPASYDARTYGNPKTYAEFLRRDNDLHYVFLCHSPARISWKIDKDELLEAYDTGVFKFPEFCPDTGVMLDYGLGNNKTTQSPQFKPSFEHKMSRHEIAVKGLDIQWNNIENLEIISSSANTYRNDGTFIHRLQLFCSELMRRGN